MQLGILDFSVCVTRPYIIDGNCENVSILLILSWVLQPHVTTTNPPPHRIPDDIIHELLENSLSILSLKIHCLSWLFATFSITNALILIPSVGWTPGEWNTCWGGNLILTGVCEYFCFYSNIFHKFQEVGSSFLNENLSFLLEV